VHKCGVLFIDFETQSMVSHGQFSTLSPVSCVTLAKTLVDRIIKDGFADMDKIREIFAHQDEQYLFSFGIPSAISPLKPRGRTAAGYERDLTFFCGRVVVVISKSTAQISMTSESLRQIVITTAAARISKVAPFCF
jgi:hypothetical protein